MADRVNWWKGLHMDVLNGAWTRVMLAPRDDRGDVPGWVMITVMTAALVVLLLGVARDQLGDMLSAALERVQGESS